VSTDDVDVESGATSQDSEMISIGNCHTQLGAAGEGDASAVNCGGVCNEVSLMRTVTCMVWPVQG
jgi:hypothetical protein